MYLDVEVHDGCELRCHQNPVLCFGLEDYVRYPNDFLQRECFQFLPSGVIGMGHEPVVFIGFRESDFKADELSVFVSVSRKDFEFSFFNEFEDFRDGGFGKPVEKVCHDVLLT